MLRMLGREEVDSIIAEHGNMEVHCEFCNQRYDFDPVDIEQVFADTVVCRASESRH